MKSAVRFSVGRYQFVIDVALVQEVMPANGTELPHNYYPWREQNLPVIHLAAHLGGQGSEQQPMVISNSLQDSDTLFLLVVDRVHGLVDMSADQCAALPTTLAGIQDMVESVWRMADADSLLLALRTPLTDWFRAEHLRGEQS
jgi:chemotaxis signal transduction protein